MKAKTIKKTIKSVKKPDSEKDCSAAKIREAIAYWKGRLASLNEGLYEKDNEADEVPEKDVKNAEVPVIQSESKVVEQAENNPVAVFNPTKRFWRMHNYAVKVVKEKLAKLLHDKGLKDISDGNIVVENSAMDDDDYDIDADTIVVKIKVQIEKAQLKGFRKFLAVLKEEDKSLRDIDEASLWGALFKGIGGTAKGVSDAAKEKIAAANKLLKEQVGVKAMQEYFLAFFGKKFAGRINAKTVFAGGDAEGTTGAEFVYCSAVDVKHS